MGILRFLLALSVAVAHAPGGKLSGFGLLNAYTAVQAFYIISGFLITMVLNERKSYRSAINFYTSRYLRLWPAYLVVALLSLILFKWSAMSSLLPAMSVSAIAFIAFSNLTLFFQDWFPFLEFDQGH